MVKAKKHVLKEIKLPANVKKGKLYWVSSDGKLDKEKDLLKKEGLLK